MNSSSSRREAMVTRCAIAALALAAGSATAFGQCSGYSISSTTGATITPGVTNIGNAGDDVATNVMLPFAVSFYGQSYNSASISSNGIVQFGASSTAYSNNCLPSASFTTPTLVAHWDDLRTDGTNRGIFTSVTGTAPNRVFNIEWRATYFGQTSLNLNFQVRLYEDNSRVEYVYASVPNTGVSATVGIQGSSTASNQFSCNTSALAAGQMLTFVPVNSSTVLCATGGASPSGINNCNGGSTLLTVNVPPASSPASTGIAVVGNLTSIGGSATQAFYDDGTNGDVTAGDSVFSYQASIPSSVTPGTKTVNFSAADQQGRSGTGTLSVTVNCVTVPAPVLGPNVYTIAITDVPRWGTTADGTITAYSVGTTSSNNGDYPVLWVDSSAYLPDFDQTRHPVISQNMYRLKNYGGYSRFEQLGQSWLKHGFVSTNSGCTPNTQLWRPSLQNYQAFGGDVLAVNCTDTYGGSLNGSQTYLGPKSVVNATLGTSAFIRGGGTGESNTRGRLQVQTADVAGQPAGTRFYVDAYYVAADDSQFVRANQTVADNAMNNASWRELNASQVNTASSVAFVGGTQQFNPGIFAWRAADAGVTLITADHNDTPNPGTGFLDPLGNPSFPGTFIKSRYWVAAKATSLGGGLYRYEYAVYNHNSDRSAEQFKVPVPAGATVSNVSFNAPKWHSGEPYSNAPWTNARVGNEIVFATEPYATNQNANALRWGSLYNFGFTANVAPTTGNATIKLFKPGFGATPISAIPAAGLPVPTVPAGCGPADLAGQGGVPGADGTLDNNDFVVFIDYFFNANPLADVGSQGGVAGSDGQFDNNDFVVFINEFFEGC